MKNLQKTLFFLKKFDATIIAALLFILLLAIVIEIYRGQVVTEVIITVLFS